MSHHLFWITSRAAGTTALLLSSAAVCLGLLMGARLIRGGRGDLRVLHEALSLGTLAALALHGFSLLGDAYLRLSLSDVLVPLASGYREPWTAIGVLSGWLLTVLGLSYYVRGRIGVQRWKTLHRFTALAWIGGMAHSLGEGTDAGQAWFLVAAGMVAVPAALLLALRMAGSGGRPPARRAGAAPPSSPALARAARSTEGRR